MSSGIVNAPNAAADPRLTETSFDEDDSWVPLESPSKSSPDDNRQPVEEVVTPGMASAEISTTAMVSRSNSAVAASTAAATNNTSGASARPSSTGSDSVQVLQRRVEMRRHLKQRLVHHPIHLLWSHFLWHLAQEFWNLDVQIRLAVLFLAVGAACKVFCMMTWYLWYPRTILLLCGMLGSWIYLNANDIPQQLQGIVEAVVHLPNRIPETLERLDPHQARILCVVLFFVPTLLQMRTISFLAGLNATGGGFQWNSGITLLMVAISAFYLTPPRTKAARDISQLCLLVLYGSALWITLQNWDILTMPSLAAPFFLSTGTLLLAYDDHDSMEWFSRTVRYALRLTLRDILATVGESVQEDEMLQLAMLRWIVDYWSYTPPQQQQQQQQQQSASTNHAASNPPATNTTPTQTSPQQELQWDELLPMLNMATDQMASEVHSLQHPQSGQSASQSNASPPAGTETSNMPGSHPNNNPSASPADDPLQGLHAMLGSMNVDDRAKPAVAAYKRNVEEFPPSRDLALGVSIIRRCPACLTLLWHVLVGSMFQPFTISLRIFLLLLPLIGLEVMRIRAWAAACEALSRLLEDERDDLPTEETTTEHSRSSTATSVVPYSKLLSRVDPMTILLSGDDDTIVSQVRTATNDGVMSVTAQMTIPSLLIVWRNVQSSVKALEVGLTAARCAQTGALAVEFAKNVMSLAQFGSEVSRHGWMHGLTVIAKEVIFNHHGDVRRPPEGSSGTFTHAAVSAVHNGTVVARNLQVLAREDDNVGHIVGPIVGLFGYVGSLFQGKDDNQNQQNEEDAQDGATTEETTPVSKTEGKKDAEEKKAADGPAITIQDNDTTATKSKESISEDKNPPQTAAAQDRWDDLPQQEHGQESTATAVADAKVATTMDGETGEDYALDNQIDLKPAGDTIIQIQETADEAAACDSEAISATEAPEDKSPSIIFDQESKSQRVELKSVPGKETNADAPEDLALVMELIADAFELNLIDEVISIFAKVFLWSACILQYYLT